jgi:hypothetical protein
MPSPASSDATLPAEAAAEVDEGGTATDGPTAARGGGAMATGTGAGAAALGLAASTLTASFMPPAQ